MSDDQVPRRALLVSSATALIAATLPLAAVPQAVAATQTSLRPGKEVSMISKSNSAILLIDHQDMTVGWIQSQPKDVVVANVRMLARIGSELGIPLLVTSTMEQQIGTNIKDVQDTAPAAYAARVKRGGTLNCFLDPAFKSAVAKLGRRSLILAGLTTDICLFHTSVGALKEGYDVSIVADACGSMSALADSVTFERMRGLGMTVTGGNQVLTELFTDFGTPEGQTAMKINLEEIVSKQAAHAK